MNTIFGFLTILKRDIILEHHEGELALREIVLRHNNFIEFITNMVQCTRINSGMKPERFETNIMFIGKVKMPEFPRVSSDAEERFHFLYDKNNEVYIDPKDPLDTELHRAGYIVQRDNMWVINPTYR